jgi:hypothetical protein
MSPQGRLDDLIARDHRRPAGPLTVEQLEFARVLGRLLAERWVSRDPSPGWPSDSSHRPTTPGTVEKKPPNSA